MYTHLVDYNFVADNTERVSLHSFSRCCLPKLRNHANFRENPNL